jgi:hypothetical protein
LKDTFVLKEKELSAMRRIELTAILIVCLSSFGLIGPPVSAEKITLTITGGVYHMISTPYMPEDRDPQISLEDDLDLYDKSQWRFFRYDPLLLNYAELKSPEWDPARHDFDYGKGYWIISKSDIDIDIEGVPIGQDWILLDHQGDRWNQIGNVYDYDFPIVGLYVAKDSSPLMRKQLIDDVANDLTYVTLQEYVDGDYVDIPGPGKIVLEVGKAYWLRVNEGVGEPVRLYFLVRPAALSGEINLSEEFFERVAQQEDPPDPPPTVESSATASFAGGSGGGGGGGCFIATAAYGNYDDPGVQLLRDFRDRYLLKNRFGRFFVDTYYRHGPSLAGLVAKHKPIGVLARCNLMPFIGMSAVVSKMNAYAFLVFIGFPLLAGLFLVKRTKGAWGRCKPKLSRELKERKREK